MHHLLKVENRSYGESARLLGLPNKGQLYKLHHGLINETTAMKASVRRARDRSERAFFKIKEPQAREIDGSMLQVLLEDLALVLEKLRQLI